MKVPLAHLLVNHTRLQFKNDQPCINKKWNDLRGG